MDILAEREPDGMINDNDGSLNTSIVVKITI